MIPRINQTDNFDLQAKHVGNRIHPIATRNSPTAKDNLIPMVPIWNQLILAVSSLFRPKQALMLIQNSTGSSISTSKPSISLRFAPFTLNFSLTIGFQNSHFLLSLYIYIYIYIYRYRYTRVYMCSSVSLSRRGKSQENDQNSLAKKRGLGIGKEN